MNAVADPIVMCKFRQMAEKVEATAVVVMVVMELVIADNLRHFVWDNYKFLVAVHIARNSSNSIQIFSRNIQQQLH